MAKNGETVSPVIAFRMRRRADYDALMEKARAAGMKPSEFLRDVVLANKTQIVARKKPTVDRVRMLRLFAKTSNNMNQIAHRINADHLRGKLNEGTYDELLYQLEVIGNYLRVSLQNVD